MCAQPKAADLLADLPLTFEENRGRLHPEVLFSTTSDDRAIFVTRHGLVVTLGDKSKRSAISLSLLGATDVSFGEGQGQSVSNSNYLIGANSNWWQTRIPSFGSVMVKHPELGIDSRFYGNGKQVENDFILHAGTDSRRLRLHVEGEDSLSINSSGDLVIETKSGSLSQKAPVAYQIMGNRRVVVGARYRLLGNHQVSILVDPYDRSQDLIVDPILTFSTYLGGNVDQQPAATAVDASGNIYITGYTSSPNFPTTVGAYRVALNGSQDIFVTKLNPTATAIIYSTLVGGSGSDSPGSIAVDSNGNAYVSGSTSSTDFPVTAGSVSSAPSGTVTSAVLFKLNGSGTSLSYSATFPGINITSAVIDASGAVYFTGTTSLTTFGAIPSNAVSLGNLHVIVVKISPAGDQFIYKVQLGGRTVNSSAGLVVDSAGQTYVTGITNTGDFPVTSGAFQTANLQNFNQGFIFCLNSSGTTLIYSTFLGGTQSGNGTGDTVPIAITLDSSRNVYLAGYTYSPNFPTTSGAFLASLPPGQHGFVTKLNSSGSALVYSTLLGGSQEDIIRSIAVDSSGSAVVTGYTLSPDFPTTANAFPPPSPPHASGFFSAVFVSKLRSDGTGLAFSSYLNPSKLSSNAIPTGIALDSVGNPIISGYTNSTSLPTTPGVVQSSNPLANPQYASSIYVMKFDLASPVLCSEALSLSSASAPAVGGSGSISVYTSPGCPWEIVNTGGSAFAALTPSSGVGSGSFTYTIPVNTGAPRTITLQVGTVALTISQAGCQFVLSATTLYFPASGGSRQISVTTSPACAWTTSSVLSGFTISGSGTGSGSTTITASANSSAAKGFSFFVAGQSVFVNQAAAASLNSANIKVGVMQPQYSAWALDSNGNGVFDPGDRYFPFLTVAPDIALVGDWTGDGHAKGGIYSNGFFALDTNNNGIWDGPSGGDQFIAFGGNPGEIPIVGDWNGDGRAKIGIYNHGFWILDTNGDGVFDAGDQFIAFGGNAGEQPVLGDWNGDGRMKVGFMTNGTWVLDYNGSGTFDSADKIYSFPYIAGDKAIVGDWNGTHTTKIGIYRAGFWILDYNGNGSYDGPTGGDKFYAFGGNVGEIPIVGDWNGSGTTKIGFYLHGFWCQDYNGNGTFDGQGAGLDRFFALGGSVNEQPVLGAW